METNESISKIKKEVTNYLNNVEKEEVQVDKIISNTNLDRIEVLKALLYLEGENKLEIKERSVINPEITEKAEEHLNDLFPLERALKKLEDGMQIKKFLNKFENSSYIIGKLKERNWIKIKKENDVNTVKLTQEGYKFLEETIKERKIVDKIHSSNISKSELNTAEYKDLRKRKFIDESKELIRYVKLNKQL